MDEIFYAESLHHHQRKELDEKRLITTGNPWVEANKCQINYLECPYGLKVFYKIKIKSYMRINNHVAAINSMNEDGDENRFTHKENVRYINS